MIPLTMVRPGERVTIRKITGKDEVRQHLAELGFVVNGMITVVTQLAGNLILQVKDSRVALDQSMATRIMVSESGSKGPRGPHGHHGWHRGW